MRHWRWYSKLLFALLVAAFAYFVWPTPWQYYMVPGSSSPAMTTIISIESFDSFYRINRATGWVQVWRRGGKHGDGHWERL